MFLVNSANWAIKDTDKTKIKERQNGWDEGKGCESKPPLFKTTRTIFLNLSYEKFDGMETKNGRVYIFWLEKFRVNAFTRSELFKTFLVRICIFNFVSVSTPTDPKLSPYSFINFPQLKNPVMKGTESITKNYFCFSRQIGWENFDSAVAN